MSGNKKIQKVKNWKTEKKLKNGRIWKSFNAQIVVEGGFTGNRGRFFMKFENLTAKIGFLTGKPWNFDGEHYELGNRSKSYSEQMSLGNLQKMCSAKNILSTNTNEWGRHWREWEEIEMFRENWVRHSQAWSTREKKNCADGRKSDPWHNGREKTLTSAFDTPLPPT